MYHVLPNTELVFLARGYNLYLLLSILICHKLEQTSDKKIE